MTRTVFFAVLDREEKEKRADVENAVCSRILSHTSSQVSVAPGILACPGVVIALSCFQQLKATKYKRSTSNERLYRNAKIRYVTANRADALPSPALSLSQVC
jgi:RAB protein geranylgeranyltransferase component A